MIYRFKNFVLDEARLELWRAGEEIAVQGRVLRALIYLVKHRDHVVSKDELSEAVWSDLVVSDAALSQVIMYVRKALSDEGEQQALLKTVRGRGFRFVAEVTTDAVSDAAETQRVPSATHVALVGRAAELDALTLWLDAATRGHGACVLVAGEPGIGKSSLVEALASDAPARQVDVVWGKAWEDGGAPPFWPFTQALRELAHKHGLQSLKQLADADWAELSGLLSTTDTTDAAADLAHPRSQARDPRNRLALFGAFARLLRSVAAPANPDRGSRDSAEYRAQLDAYTSGWHRYMAAILECVQESCLGNFARADALSRQAYELGAQREALEPGFYAVRCMFRWLDGRTGSTAPEGFTLDPPNDLPSQFHTLWLLAWIRAGRTQQARAALAAIAARGFEHLPLDPLHRPTLAVLAQSAAALGEQEHARKLYNLLVPFDDLHVVLQPGVYLGPVAYTLGLVAHAFADHDAAILHFEAAIEACNHAYARAFLFKIYLAQARALIESQASDGRGRGDAAVRAMQRLQQAEQLSAEINCEPWLHQARALPRGSLDMIADRDADLARSRGPRTKE